MNKIDDLSWLTPIWEFYGKQKDFEMICGDWPDNYLELVRLLQTADQNIVKGWPSAESGTDQAGHPNAWSVRIRPLGVKMLQERPRQVHRQVTVDGVKFDVRSRVNFELLNADIEQVHVVAESYLTQLRNKPNLRTRKRLKCELHRVMMLRGPELRRDLYGSICLRIGADLPPDFWHIPQELLPNPPTVCVVKSKEACV